MWGRESNLRKVVVRKGGKDTEEGVCEEGSSGEDEEEVVLK